MPTPPTFTFDRAQYPLPGDFALSDDMIETVQLGTLSIGVAGFIAQGADGEAVGAAAAAGAPPLGRAYFELLERAYTLLAARGQAASFPEVDRQGTQIGEQPREAVFPADDPAGQWTTSTSNGVALHVSPELACAGAEAELFERDALLRAWYGYAPVAHMALGSGLAHGLQGLGCNLVQVRFGPDESAYRTVGLLLDPGTTERRPTLLSSGAGASDPEALQAAERELVQRMAFLWEEPLPEQPPSFSPDVDFHQTFHLHASNRKALVEFFRGGHQGLAPCEPPVPAAPAATRFVRLTPPGAPLCVVRALNPSCLPLRFGRDPLAAHLPSHLQTHPIS